MAVEMTGDEVRLWQSLQKIVHQQAKVEQGFDKIGRTGKDAGKKTEDGFGGAALSKLQRYAMGVLSISTALAGVSTALSEIRRMADAAGSRIIDAESGKAALTRLAKDAKDREALIAGAERLRTERGLEPAEAYKLTEAARLAGPGVEAQVDLFAQLKPLGYDPKTAMAAAGRLPEWFGGEGAGTAGAGTPRQILNKLIAAAGTGQDPTEIASAAANMGKAWASAGGQDEELLALLGGFAKPYGGAEAAGAGVKSLADHIAKNRDLIRVQGVEEMGAMDILRNLGQWEQEGKLRTKGGAKIRIEDFLGNAEAKYAYDQYQVQRADIEKRLGEVKAAEAGTGPHDLLAGRFDIVGQDLTTKLVTGLEADEQDLKALEEKTAGRFSLMADRIVKQTASRQLAEGESPWWIAAKKRSQGIERWISGDETFVERSVERVEGPGGGIPGEPMSLELQTMAREVVEAAREMRAAAKENREAAKQIKRSTGGGTTLSKPDVDR
ncbi:MAG: hypothetical protein ABIK89_23315 [Planctomycetota bacterium]